MSFAAKLLRLILVGMHQMTHEVKVPLIMRAIIVFCLAVSSLAAANVPFPRAEEMYNRAQYQAAIEELKPYPAQPEALRLTGKSLFMLGDFKRAAEYFRKLVRINPLSSMDFQWLGKTFARRADTSNPISAPGFVTKAQKSFERSVELEPGSLSALKELLELYLDHQGLEKAKAVADRISQIDSHEGMLAQNKVLIRRQELGTPEERVRMAIDQIPQRVGRAAASVSGH